MIVWTVAGILSWGTFFGLMWATVLDIESIAGLSTILPAVLSLLIGAFSGFAEVAARQEIAKLSRLSMKGPSIVYAGSLEHGNTDEAKTASDS